jgi:C1A family cysteine protease
MFARNPNVTNFVVGKNNTNAQMKQIIANGPATALIYADTEFQSYKSGVYTGCPTNPETSFANINHAVILVGYDINGNYIIKNSWGTNWGQSGFGVVSKDADCGLSAFVYQFQSSASGGSGVLYYNQVNFTSPNSGWKLESILMLGLILIISLMH